MKNRTVYLAVGIIAVGVLFLLRSFFAPLSDELKTAAVTAEQLFAYAAMGLGSITAILYAQLSKVHRILGASIGAFIFLLGLLLFLKPAFGTTLLNSLLALLLTASGVFKLLQVRRITSKKLRLTTTISALVSIAVAVLAVVYFFTTAKYELLSFLVIDFMMNGFILWHLATLNQSHHALKKEENNEQ